MGVISKLERALGLKTKKRVKPKAAKKRSSSRRRRTPPRGKNGRFKSRG